MSCALYFSDCRECSAALSLKLDRTKTLKNTALAHGWEPWVPSFFVTISRSETLTRLGSIFCQSGNNNDAIVIRSATAMDMPITCRRSATGM